MRIRAFLLCPCVVIAMAVFSRAAEAPLPAFPGQISLGNQELNLNGTALRTFFGIRIYEAGLYLTAPCKDETEIMIRNHGAKRLKIFMHRAVPEAKFAEAARENLERNFSVEEKTKFAAELEAFFQCFENEAEIASGSVVTIDYLPGQGTIITSDGKQRAVIAGHDFYHALLRLWIGKPLQASMKTGLLGSQETR